jgi:hypothetical protein
LVPSSLNGNSFPNDILRFKLSAIPETIVNINSSINFQNEKFVGFGIFRLLRSFLYGYPFWQNPQTESALLWFIHLFSALLAVLVVLVYRFVFGFLRLQF